MKIKKQFPHKRLLLVLASALVLVGLAVGVAIGGTPEPQVRTESGEVPPVAPQSGPYEVSGPEADQFAVLSSAPTTTVTPAEGEPKPSAQALPISLAGQGISDPVPAHVVNVPLQGQVTVAEVGSDVCLGAGRLATCGTPSDALAGQLVAVELCSPELQSGSLRLIGMAPNGVQSIDVTNRDGSSETIDVVGNVFVATISGVPDRLTWQGGSATTVQVPVPPEYSPKECA